jgi:ribosomal protein S18 acetylase RimI-like enzyme
MSEAFIVRTATLSDYDGMRALLAAVDEMHRLNVPWMFRAPIAEPRPKEFFEQLLSSEDSTVLVAEAREQLVGVATASLRDAPNFSVFVTQRWGVLDSIAVLASWRRQGVGTSLTGDAERWAQSRRAKWLELGVYEFNDDARSFYRKLGYLPVSAKFRKPFNEAG